MVVRSFSEIVTNLTVEEFQESQVTRATHCYPLEYYINELLLPDKENCKVPENKCQVKEHKATVVRIEEILHLQGDETSGVKSKAAKKSRVGEITQLRGSDFATIGKCYSLRESITTRNPLLLGVRVFTPQSSLLISSLHWLRAGGVGVKREALFIVTRDLI